MPLITTSRIMMIRNLSGSNDDDDYNEFLPEGVDYSEGGWATDFAAALISILFFCSSWNSRHFNGKYSHFLWMFFGTFISHFFGGICHRWYWNRAADGVGQVGFYVTFTIGYAGNCMRFGKGWGLSPVWTKTAVLTFAYMLFASIYCVVKMERTRSTRDDATKGDVRYRPDTIFLFAEGVVAIFEVLASFTYLCQNRSNAYAVIGTISNIFAWVAVYAGFLVFTALKMDYDSALMQRIFHYGMIILVWACNSIATEATPEDLITEAKGIDASEKSASTSQQGLDSGEEEPLSPEAA